MKEMQREDPEFIEILFRIFLAIYEAYLKGSCMIIRAIRFNVAAKLRLPLKTLELFRIT